MPAIALTAASIDAHTVVPVVTGLGLTEAPWYDEFTESVCFSDVTGGGVWRYSPNTGRLEQIVGRRRGIGGLVGNTDGQLVVTGKSVMLARPGDGLGDTVCRAEDAGPHVIGFNDLCADEAGRVYVGALTFLPLTGRPSPGLICVIEPGGDVRRVADDVVLPNGMAFDWTASLLYVCDSEQGSLIAYRQQSDGRLTVERRLRCAPGGRPDGVAVAADGSLWVARAEAGVIDVLDESGEVQDRWSFPGGAVTNLCFGGKCNDTLFLTGGGIPPDDRPGGLWAARAPVAGSAVRLGQVGQLLGR